MTAEQVSALEFGRMLGLMEAMRKEVSDLKERMVWRTDNLETRIELLEKAHAKNGIWYIVGEKLLYTILGGVVGAIMIKLGLAV